MKHRTFCSLGLTTFLTIVLAACSAYQRVSPIEKTFLEDVDTSKKIENLPFQHSWVRPGANPYDYREIFVKPIRLDKLPPNAWETSLSAFITSRDDYLNHASELGRYFHAQLREKLHSHPAARFSVVNTVKPGTAVIEIAFTELEFSHPIARADSLAAPVPGAGAALSTMVDPHAAIAARLSDGTSGKLIATMGDRKFSPARLIDLNKLTVSSTLREICANWATEIANSIQEGRFSKIKKEGTYSLLPW